MSDARIGNAPARRALIALNGLSGTAGVPLRGGALRETVHALGYVQLDSISVVERAHHHILHTRGAGYRQASLRWLIERERALFEHWTHDAAVIPTAFFPYWRHRFAREKARLHGKFQKNFGDRFAGELDTILTRIEREGPMRARDFEAGERRSTGWWDWHPSKTALEYLWHTGELSITRREGFQKVYDLTERVVPAAHLARRVDHEEFVDWACREALTRLGFATRGEIAAFFDLLSPTEVEGWIAANRGALASVAVEGAAGGRPRAAYALPAMLDALADAPPAGDRVRILSPFDPLLRDRARAERVFGFHYRIEVFVPEARRKYGYYVFPVMRGERIVGRIDMKAERAADRLVVRRFWPEAGVRASALLKRKLEAEIEKLRRFSGVATTEFAEGWFGG